MCIIINGYDDDDYHYIMIIINPPSMCMGSQQFAFTKMDMDLHERIAHFWTILSTFA